MKIGPTVLNGLNVDFPVRGIHSDCFLYPVLIFFSGLDLFFNCSEKICNISHSCPKSLSKLLSSLIAQYNLGSGSSFPAKVGSWGVQLVLGHVSLLGNFSINHPCHSGLGNN